MRLGATGEEPVCLCLKRRMPRDEAKPTVCWSIGAEKPSVEFTPPDDAIDIRCSRSAKRDVSISW